jgi:hypothetical protein
VKVRHAGFALRVVRRRSGDAAILYRRTLNRNHKERLTKVAPIAPLAFTAGTPLLRSAVRAMEGNGAKLSTGAFHPLDADWGARVACYALVASRLRRAERLSRAASHLGDADAAEAAWWLGLMSGRGGRRAVRALRILVEAVN